MGKRGRKGKKNLKNYPRRRKINTSKIEKKSPMAVIICAVGMGGLIIFLGFSYFMPLISHFFFSTSFSFDFEELFQHTQNILSFGIRMHPNTPGLNLTRHYIKDTLVKNSFELELDIFESPTPIGNIKFENIIGNYPSNIDLKFGGLDIIIFAAHYDSKYFTRFDFLGATDSAVPCAMLLHLSDVIKNNSKIFENKQIKLIFFDGEEAFNHWTASDSLYGSRHLANVLEKAKNFSYSDVKAFILLDLLGFEKPKFHRYHNFPAGSDELYNSFLMTEYQIFKGNRYFLNSKKYMISDDHVPFLKYNIPTVHVIANPFPPVWHTERDNGDILEWNSINDVQKVLLETLYKL